MPVNPDENPMHASHDAVDPSLIPDAVIALPEQELKRYAKVTDKEMLVQVPGSDEDSQIPLRHLRIVSSSDDPTHFDAYDKRLESPDDERKSRKKAIIAGGLTAAAVLGIVAGATTIAIRKKK